MQLHLSVQQFSPILLLCLLFLLNIQAFLPLHFDRHDQVALIRIKAKTDWSLSPNNLSTSSPPPEGRKKGEHQGAIWSQFAQTGLDKRRICLTTFRSRDDCGTTPTALNSSTPKLPKVHRISIAPFRGNHFPLRLILRSHPCTKYICIFLDLQRILGSFGSFGELLQTSSSDWLTGLV